ncbi:low affinity iron permease family protein [Sediminibacterium roseum]|uniref:Low affinity iron permease family protein n=1 Tax=Sediminibacterium roseum TaxID=1978412 RepID=A0ABW9ZTR6_9BACT|nr:low affinity iron permease family protein [Sediminibacterium roseum]NCI50521.1 low affinity iron permease family protein [Sediminibacterium roseum]
MKTTSKKKNWFNRWFEKVSTRVTRATGSPTAVLLALIVIFAWLVTGPVFHYSDTWQLVINTGTTIITFVMVFIIQHSQNKDTTAIQLKLNELIATNERSSNRLVNIEDLSDEELNTLKSFYITLARLSKKEKDIFRSHSIDEAEDNNRDKYNKLKKEASQK